MSLNRKKFIHVWNDMSEQLISGWIIPLRFLMSISYKIEVTFVVPMEKYLFCLLVSDFF